MSDLHGTQQLPSVPHSWPVGQLLLEPIVSHAAHWSVVGLHTWLPQELATVGSQMLVEPVVADHAVVVDGAGAGADARGQTAAMKINTRIRTTIIARTAML